MAKENDVAAIASEPRDHSKHSVYTPEKRGKTCALREEINQRGQVVERSSSTDAETCAQEEVSDVALCEGPKPDFPAVVICLDQDGALTKHLAIQQLKTSAGLKFEYELSVRLKDTMNVLNDERSIAVVKNTADAKTDIH